MKKSHPDHDPKMKCLFIDNPDYVKGQGVYAMDSGRRMRVNNSRLITKSEPDVSSPSLSKHYNSHNNYNRAEAASTPQTIPMTPMYESQPETIQHKASSGREVSEPPPSHPPPQLQHHQ